MVVVGVRQPISPHYLLEGRMQGSGAVFVWWNALETRIITMAYITFSDMRTNRAHPKYTNEYVWLSLGGGWGESVLEE